jgi:hypothetical protein
MNKFILNLPTQIIFLKSGYNIPLKDTGNQSLQLMIEMGDFGVSLIWTDIQKKQIAALAVYIFEEEDNTVEQIRNIINNAPIPGKDHRGVKIFYNFKESMLIPTKYYNEDLNEQMLSLLFGENEDTIIRTDKLDKLQICNIYRLPAELDHFITSSFPQVNYIHSSSCQILQQFSSTEMVCIVFYNAIKVMLYIDGHLYLVQQFKFNGPEDVSYHLLNICNQHDLQPTEIKLHISGMIVQDSILFQHLYNYFLHIDFISMSDQIKMKDDINDLPAHFFSHLTELATCEL